MAVNIDTGFYADNMRLDKYKTANDEKSLDAIAREFEALYLQKLLKSMRDAGQSFKSDLVETSYTEQYEEMYHNQLATHIAHTNGVGLAEAIKKQMLPHVGKEQTNPTNVPITLNHKKSPYISHLVTPEKLDRFTSFASPNDFINKLTPAMTAAGQELGVAPQVLLAQAALETGWGETTAGAYNLFGIKADKLGQRARPADLVKTHEFINGVKTEIVDKFRTYKNYQDSVQDYVAFIKDNPRYQPALAVAADPEKYVQELQKAGYATDPEYANKIIKIYAKIRMGTQ